MNKPRESKIQKAVLVTLEYLADSDWDDESVHYEDGWVSAKRLTEIVSDKRAGKTFLKDFKPFPPRRRLLKNKVSVSLSRCYRLLAQKGLVQLRVFKKSGMLRYIRITPTSK